MTLTARAAPGAVSPVSEPGRGHLGRIVSWFKDEGVDDAGPSGLSAVAEIFQEVVSAVRSHPVIADSALAGLILGIGASHSLSHGTANGQPGWWILQFALVIPLIWRRRFPIQTFLFICGVAFVQWIYGAQLLSDLAILLSLYTVATREPRRIALAAAGVVEIGVILASRQRAIGGGWGPSVVLLTGMVAAAFFLGTSVRTRKAYTAALVERAKRLESEREQQTRIAMAAERASIAREMHDIVAHSLAVMITLSDAAIVKQSSEPVEAETAMEHVSDIGRHALGETRRLLGVLRTDGRADALSPQPGLAQLDALLEQVRATGLNARLMVSGRPFAVPEGAQLAIYRILQEALTNVIKHAREATQARVSLRYSDPQVEIEVIDDGRLGSAPAPTNPAGHGLVGMVERAALYNGSVIAGPRASGGWGVTACVSAAEGAVSPAQ